MSAHEQALEWLADAERDLEVTLFFIEKEMFDRSVFSSHQAAEKALKGLFIAMRRATPPKTHNVEMLARELGAPAGLIEGAAQLTADYMPTRYFDVALAQQVEYTPEIAGNRSAEAKGILDWVKETLDDVEKNPIRDAVVRKFLEEKLPDIQRIFEPVHIILFGSRATGNAREDSDIDLILVSDRYEGMHFPERMASFSKEIRPDQEVEVFCYTPEEFEKMRKRIGVIADAAREGIWIQ